MAQYRFRFPEILWPIFFILFVYPAGLGNGRIEGGRIGYNSRLPVRRSAYCVLGHARFAAPGRGFRFPLPLNL
jgi:hypothetical protein